MSILNNLFARSPFSLLQSHMEKVAACVQKLEELFDAYMKKDYELIEKKAAEIMKNREFDITIDLKGGNSTFTVLTSDLSLDYIKINADYRS